MIYIYNNNYSTYFADVDTDGKINIDTMRDDIRGMCDIKILPVDVDEIVILRNGVRTCITKSVKANTIIFIIDKYTYNNAIKLHIDVKLVYTQDEIVELLKFQQEYYDKRKAELACKDCENCGSVVSLS